MKACGQEVSAGQAVQPELELPPDWNDALPIGSEKQPVAKRCSWDPSGDLEDAPETELERSSCGAGCGSG